jgi:hypothetical protein
MVDHEAIKQKRVENMINELHKMRKYLEVMRDSKSDLKKIKTIADNLEKKINHMKF